MPWIILDRDGVINEDSDAYIKSPDEWHPIPGSLEAVARLTQAGYSIAILSNQSGLARGLFNADQLDAIHALMRASVEASGGRIAALHFCPHGPDGDCACRKPRAGLFERLAREQGINLAGVPAIGDSYRDIEAARAVGASPILVRTGKGRRTLLKHPDPGCPVFADLYEATRFLLDAHAN